MSGGVQRPRPEAARLAESAVYRKAQVLRAVGLAFPALPPVIAGQTTFTREVPLHHEAVTCLVPKRNLCEGSS